jgi:hypothetical protein
MDDAATNTKVQLPRVLTGAIYISIAFLRLISSDAFHAQSLYAGDTPAGKGSPDAVPADNPSTGNCCSDNAPPDQGSSGPTDHDWVQAWFRRVDQARASQPHFVSPIVTTHTMLVQQFRYDMSWQRDPAGNATTNYGVSRGLEIIPATRFEVGVFPTSYLVHRRTAPDGFGDFAFQVKFRAFSAPEDHGDYFVGIFLGGSSLLASPPMGSVTPFCLPPSAWGRASVLGTFRTRLERIFPSAAPVSSAERSYSTAKSIIVSRERSGPCWSRIPRFGRAVRWMGGSKSS